MQRTLMVHFILFILLALVNLGPYIFRLPPADGRYSKSAYYQTDGFRRRGRRRCGGFRRWQIGIPSSSSSSKRDAGQKRCPANLPHLYLDSFGDGTVPRNGRWRRLGSGGNLCLMTLREREREQYFLELKGRLENGNKNTRRIAKSKKHFKYRNYRIETILRAKHKNHAAGEEFNSSSNLFFCPALSIKLSRSSGFLFFYPGFLGVPANAPARSVESGQMPFLKNQRLTRGDFYVVFFREAFCFLNPFSLSTFGWEGWKRSLEGLEENNGGFVSEGGAWKKSARLASPILYHVRNKHRIGYPFDKNNVIK